MDTQIMIKEEISHPLSFQWTVKPCLQENTAETIPLEFFIHSKMKRNHKVNNIDYKMLCRIKIEHGHLLKIGCSWLKRHLCQEQDRCSTILNVAFLRMLREHFLFLHILIYFDTIT